MTTALQPTASLLTPAGRGAVATIRFHGDARLIDEALFQAAGGKPLAEQSLGRIVFGHWGSEEIVVCRVDETTLEIHCHGGEAASRRILDDLASAGCHIETWQNQTAGKQGVFEAEWMEAVSRASTFRTAEILLQQYTLLPAAVRELRSWWNKGAKERSCRVRSADRTHWTLASRLSALLQWADFGRHLIEPWNVVIAGRPNAGKSSLMNALLGYCRAIVYDQPGTTRDVVTAETALDGWPLRFCDTAGLHTTAETLESAGIERARRQLREADCRVILLDISAPPQAEDRQLLAEWPDALVVAHKCDLPSRWGKDIPQSASWVSSLTGDGIEELTRRLVERLVPAVPEAGTPIPFTDRQIRLLDQARQEVEREDETGFFASLDRFLDGNQ